YLELAVSKTCGSASIATDVMTPTFQPGVTGPAVRFRYQLTQPASTSFSVSNKSLVAASTWQTTIACLDKTRAAGRAQQFVTQLYNFAGTCNTAIAATADLDDVEIIADPSCK